MPLNFYYFPSTKSIRYTMGYISAIKITEVQGDAVQLLFYQFQNCLEITDYDMLEDQELMQISLLFLYEAIRDYEEEFQDHENDFPLYAELARELGTEAYCMPNIAFTGHFVAGAAVTTAAYDIEEHGDDAFEQFELEDAFEETTIEQMPHLLIDVQLTSAQWAKGITQGMYKFSGLNLLAHEWLAEEL